jgi:hypothetical protein
MRHLVVARIGEASEKLAYLIHPLGQVPVSGLDCTAVAGRVNSKP